MIVIEHSLFFTSYLGETWHEASLVVGLEEERVSGGDELAEEGDHLRHPRVGVAEEGLAHRLLWHPGQLLNKYFK